MKSQTQKAEDRVQSVAVKIPPMVFDLAEPSDDDGG